MTTEPIALTTAAEAAAAAQPDPATAPVPGTCGCGGHDDASLPVLDARVIPQRPGWVLSRDDVHGFVGAYFASLAAVAVFIA